jgi:AraC-like DNA-binding protein
MLHQMRLMGMQKLVKGEFFGNHKHELSFNNFLLTDTEYTHEKVDWHYHENPYFTYLLQGKLFEANRKESYYLEPGSLLFHNWQDAHHNIKPPEYTRGFHIELSHNWFAQHNLSSSDFEGSFSIENPLVKQQLNTIVLETKLNDIYSESTIELLLLNAFNSIDTERTYIKDKRPIWVTQLKEIMNDESEVCTSLSNLASLLNIHPVHLSREFPKYFKTTLGNYLRTLKVNKAVSLLLSKKYALTEIAYLCEFCDQSHFTHSFKRVYGMTPLSFLKKQ